MNIFDVVMIVCFVGLIFAMFISRRGMQNIAGQNATAGPEPAEVYVGLRAQALSTRPEDIGLNSQPSEIPYGVIMEMRSGPNTTTLVSLADGRTSLYASPGGGLIGGAAHETVRQATQNLVKASADHLSTLTKTEEFPLPRVGHIRFYLLTCSGVFTTEEEEQGLVEGHSPLSALFTAVNEVITQFCLATVNQETP